jgi:Domain of unknown function (4846)
MIFKPLLFSVVLLFHSCNNAATVKNAEKTTVAGNRNQYHSIQAIPVPQGFTRTGADSNSFAAWLRTVVLKEDRTVYLFNGTKKRNQQAQFAVMDITVGNKDLQQCADAVMRLRAEYLFSHKRFTEIVFYDNDKTAYSFSAPYSREHFSNYLQQVFGRCGSASLSKQLKTKTELTNIQPGDVLIRGGFPGHAVIVTDVATDSSGKKIFMLAQSYMPAQEIHVLNNPVNEKLSPWYEVTGAEKIITPEYIFNRNELKSW